MPVVLFQLMPANCGADSEFGSNVAPPPSAGTMLMDKSGMGLLLLRVRALSIAEGSTLPQGKESNGPNGFLWSAVTGVTALHIRQKRKAAMARGFSFRYTTLTDESNIPPT